MNSPDLTVAELAYLAGIMDGEGSISMVQSHASRTYGKYVYPLVRVANTDKTLIDWIVARVPFGHTHTTHRPTNRSKLVYHIGWAAGNAVEVLRLIRPYMVIKAAQADVVLNLQKLNEQAEQEAGGKFGRGRELPWKVEVARMEAFREIQRLNRKGWSDALDS